MEIFRAECIVREKLPQVLIKMAMIVIAKFFIIEAGRIVNKAYDCFPDPHDLQGLLGRYPRTGLEVSLQGAR